MKHFRDAMSMAAPMDTVAAAGAACTAGPVHATMADGAGDGAAAGVPVAATCDPPC